MNGTDPKEAAAADECAFEDALARLEQIVQEMEGGKLTLDQCMGRFEEGMRYAKLCSRKLGETERKIEILMKRADGAEEWQEFSAEMEQGAQDDH